MAAATLSPDPTTWHAGNLRMQTLMHVPPTENPTAPFLTPPGAALLSTSPLLAIGALDDAGQPWTALWGGERGFVRRVGVGAMGLRTLVDLKGDPVVKILMKERQGEGDGAVFGKSRRVSGLGIDLESRRRIKVAGEIVGAVIEPTEEARGVGEAHVILKIESSLGNCPKYLNKKTVLARVPAPDPHPNPLPLPAEAIDLISKADCFFLTASASGTHLSTNYRGGPPGFIRIANNIPAGTRLVYPEYSGNRLYQTLGNLQTTPLVGIVIPDLHTGDVLYATATTEILVGSNATALIPRSNLALALTLREAHFIRRSLAVRAEDGEFSPYNPPVRQLSSERAASPDLRASIAQGSLIKATLSERKVLAPGIARLVFSTDAPIRWERGQHVALDLSDELGLGYSHMRDDDPGSLNDDLIRTFTVSAAPPPGQQTTSRFEITVREVGSTTKFLLRGSLRSGISVRVLGFDGKFSIDAGAPIGFVAAGVGITPLLAQMSDLDPSLVTVLWTVNVRDIGLVLAALERWKDTSLPMIRLFVTGGGNAGSGSRDQLIASGVSIEWRRIRPEDFQGPDGDGQRIEVDVWYVCTGKTLRADVGKWLQGKKVVSEDFSY